MGARARALRRARERRPGRRYGIRSAVQKPHGGGPIPPTSTLASISPTTATQYDGLTTVTATGTGFVNGTSAIVVDGVTYASTWLSATQVSADLPRDVFKTSGTRVITVTGATGSANLAVSSWSPANIPGVTAWWRADDLVQNPAGFCQTLNARVGTYTLTQATAANRPVYTASDAGFNGQATVGKQSGVSQVLVSNAQMQNLVGLDDGVILGVCAIDAATAGYTLGIGAQSGGTIGLYTNGATAMASSNYDGSFDRTANVTIAAGVASKVEWRHTGGTLYCRVNATELSLASGTTTSGQTQLCQLFGGGTGAFGSRFAEIVTATTVLSAANRTRWDNYVYFRYNIS